MFFVEKMVKICLCFFKKIIIHRSIEAIGMRYRWKWSFLSFRTYRNMGVHPDVYITRKTRVPSSCYRLQLWILFESLSKFQITFSSTIMFFKSCQTEYLWFSKKFFRYFDIKSTIFESFLATDYFFVCQSSWSKIINTINSLYSWLPIIFYQS